MALLIQTIEIPSNRTHEGSVNSALPSPRGRLAYIDWLRFIVVLLLAPFHAAISFTGMGSVYVYDSPVRDIVLASGTPINMGTFAYTPFTFFMDNWVVQLLFLMACIGSAFSLRRRSAAQFVQDRCNRQLPPVILDTF